MNESILYNGLRELCVKYDACISFIYNKDTVSMRIYAKHRVSQRMKTVEKTFSYDEALLTLTVFKINTIIEEEY
jgi:hypothetical protein